MSNATTYAETDLTPIARAFGALAAGIEPLLPLGPGRMESLRIASEAGANMATLTRVAAALRASREPTIVLPCHRLEKLSRGKGWARKGKGNAAEWGEREDGGYRVGPGRWTVGGNDGFSRKGEDSWTVEHIAVGGETWTIAS